MRVKIINILDEDIINEELEKLEENEKREIQSIIPFNNKIIIIHYPENEELEQEITSLKERLNKLN